MGRPRKEGSRALSPYLSGVTTDADKRSFIGSKGDAVEATTRNFYLDIYFGESITRIVQVFGVALILASFVYSIMAFMG